VLFSSAVRVRVRFSVWLVSGYAHALLLSVVIVPYPTNTALVILEAVLPANQLSDTDKEKSDDREKQKTHYSSINLNN